MTAPCPSPAASADASPDPLPLIQQWLAHPGAHVHLMGIGGIGMAGLARLLAAQGQVVDGCDAAQPHTLAGLKACGIPVVVGHSPDHLQGIDWAIYSPALAQDHPERQAACKRGLFCCRRGEVLPVLASRHRTLAVAGTHGKTTTSAMLTRILRETNADPSWCIGGELPPDGAPAGIGHSPWLVIEADESDGTLARYAPELALVTNIEFDHMEHFSGPDGLHDCFRAFLHQTTGSALVCADDPVAARLGLEVHAQSYGFASDADWRLADPEYFSDHSRFMLHPPAGAPAVAVEIPLGGRHNLLNAAGAIAAAATVCKIPVPAAATALCAYAPPRRRFEHIAEAHGIHLLADYAHHPTEIRALLSAVRQAGARRILAIFQPHRHTRTRALGPAFPPAFAAASEVFLLPVYAASEPPIPGGTSGDLLPLFRADSSAPPVHLLPDFPSAVHAMETRWQPGDWILLIGAGSIEDLAPPLRQRLLALSTSETTP